MGERKRCKICSCDRDRFHWPRQSTQGHNFDRFCERHVSPCSNICLQYPGSNGLLSTGPVSCRNALSSARETRSITCLKSKVSRFLADRCCSRQRAKGRKVSLKPLLGTPVRDP